MVHNQEIQSKHCDGVTLSVEGSLVEHRNEDGSITTDFHSHLSDEKTQTAAVVHSNMRALCNALKAAGVLNEGGRLLGVTDGCAKQHKCATAICCLSMIAAEFGIVVDRAVSCAGHGKSKVDAINANDKLTIAFTCRRRVEAAEKATEAGSQSMRVHSVVEVDGTTAVVSSAADCKRILEQSRKIKKEHAAGRCVGGENSKKVNEFCYHVRELDEKIFGLKAATIEIDEADVSFKDMCHFYACKEMGVGRAAMRRVPCNCSKCDEVIRRPWEVGVPWNEQARFDSVVGCYYSSVMEGDRNKWYLAELVAGPSSNDEDEAAMKSVVLRNITSSVCERIKVGNLGAVATVDTEAKEGYYLVEWIGEPHTDQDTGELKCEAFWCDPVPRARKWFFPTVQETVVDVQNVVDPDVVVNQLEADNMPPNTACREDCVERKALKVEDSCHLMITDEMERRDQLDFDPSIMWVDDESDDEVDEEEQNSFNI